MEPIITILIIAAMGGAVRAFLGYETQADENEPFDYGKFSRSLIRGAIAGSFVVIGTTAIFNAEITTSSYILAFFTAVGADVIVKEGTQAITKKGVQ